MAVVKIQNKDQLDQLVAKLTLRLGHKPTQQEVVDLCIQLGENQFETLVMQLSPVPILDEAKVKKIKQVANDLKNVPWDTSPKGVSLSQDDIDLYFLD